MLCGKILYELDYEEDGNDVYYGKANAGLNINTTVRYYCWGKMAYLGGSSLKKALQLADSLTGM